VYVEPMALQASKEMPTCISLEFFFCISTRSFVWPPELALHSVDCLLSCGWPHNAPTRLHLFLRISCQRTLSVCLRPPGSPTPTPCVGTATAAHVFHEGAPVPF
jgi:hypothetical protein